MREIKFRAFYNGKMIENEKLVFWNGCCYCNEAGTLHDPEHPHKASRLKGFTVVDVMQFTGLKDKNGTPIYEGDIVTDNLGRYSTVSYDVGAFWVLGKHYGCFRWELYRVYENIEVIGNIYENPELLEAKQ